MSGQRVQDHYANPGSGSIIAERILAALRGELGADVVVSPDTLAPLDQFHGGAQQATKKLAAQLQPERGEAILDIGSGIGGPARWIAEHFGCHVTGVDLTAEFCQAAIVLNEAAGMAAQVRILEGSATALPLPDAAFGRAYSQNVVMNISDKAAVYREAFRVLKPGGVLVLHNVAAGSNGPPYFPVPWASTAEQSFLATAEETRRDLIAAGFTIESFEDTTVAIAPPTSPPAAEVPTTLGLRVWLGDVINERRDNNLRSVADGRARTIEVKARKPA